MKYFKSIAVVLLMVAMVVGIVGCSFDGEKFSPEEVVNNALKEPESIRDYYAEMELTMDFGEMGKDEIIMKEWHSSEGNSRTEMENIDGSEQNIIVVTNNEMTMYDVESNQVMVIDDPELMEINQTSPKEQAMQILEGIQETHDLSVEGEAEIAGRDTYHLKAQEKGDNKFIGEIEVWVDKDSWMVLKSIVKIDDMLTETVYTKLDFKTKITDDLFIIDFPEDAEVIDMNMDGDFEETEISLEEASDVFEQAFLYFQNSDDLELARILLTDLSGLGIDRSEISFEYEKEDQPLLSLSVFESEESDTGGYLGEEKVEIRNLDGYYDNFGDVQFLSWDEEGLSYSIYVEGSELTLAEIQELAEKMVLVD